MGIDHARGELRYRWQHRLYALPLDVAAVHIVEDERVRVSAQVTGNRMIIRVVALDHIEIDSFALYFQRPFRPHDRFFLNGYQSWTDSREFSPNERIASFPGILRPVLEGVFRTNHYGDYDIVPAFGAHLHGFTYFYVRQQQGGSIDFLGSLSEAEGYTIVSVLPDDRRVIVQKDCAHLTLASGDEWKAFDLYVDVGDEEEVFSNYLRRWHELGNLEHRSTPPWTGWTSWYYHYTNISEAIVQKNLDAFVTRRIPIDIFQIDDGWQTAVGDWLDVNDKFPKGLKPIVERIHAAGYKAGLWLAPLVAEKKSRLVAKHPEWLLHDADGNPVPAGNSHLWSGDFYGLDIDHPRLRAYLTKVFETILHVWGFDLVKLDFLYGACLVPDPGKLRATKMVDTMDFLRFLVGDKYILGCGVPLGAAMGRVDICRIGPDVGHEWTNTLTRGMAIRETISTVTALENAIGRRHLSGRAFSNDPDVFFLRHLSFEGQKFDPLLALQELRWGKRIPLTDREKYTLFLLNNLFGRLVFTSDDLDEYDDATMQLYLSSFPLREKEDVRVDLIGPAPAFGEVGGCYQIRFRIGALQYWVVANLANEAVSWTLPDNGFSRDMRGQGRLHARGEIVQLAPHASLCLLEESPGSVVLLGSERHLFPGSELLECAWDGADTVTLARDERARGRGNVFLKVPPGKTGLYVQNRFVHATAVQGRENIVVVSGDET